MFKNSIKQHLSRIFLLNLLVYLSCWASAFGQTTVSSGGQTSSATITAVASADRVRITAPASVVQMRVEVYDGNGIKVWDSEIRGNVFDWHVQDGQAQRPTAGDYACVITVKNVAGRVTQKLGSIRVREKDVDVAVVETGRLSAPQSQAIGPLEEEASWTILAEDQNQTTTVIAHDGTDAQIVRGRGAISFRLGDFFTGKDLEQMRLTESGSLGIGTATPRFKLDVAGTIRAERILIAKPKQLSTDNQTASAASQDEDGGLPLAAGSGTQNMLAKWAETGGSGNLTDSSIFDNGRVGIGTTNPGARFHTVGVPGSLGAGTFQLDAATLFSNWTATYPAFEVLNTNLTNNNVSLFQFSDVASGAAHAGIGAVATNHASKFGDLFFFTKGTDGYQPRMGIYGGNVGIGTTAPSERLHVVGNALFTGNLTVNTTLSGNVVNAVSQYNLDGQKMLSASGPHNDGIVVMVRSNTFLGESAGINTLPISSLTLVDGKFNSFFGGNAGRQNSTGFANSFVGARAGENNTTGYANSFFGVNAGSTNTTGYYNSVFGFSAGSNNTTGFQNSFFGNDAGNTNTSGSNNSVFGYDADVGSDTLTNATAIGWRSYVTQNNSLVLGSINGVNGATADTNVGIGTTAPVSRLHINGNSSNFALTFTNAANVGGKRGYRIAFDNNRLTFQKADDAGNFVANQVAIDQESGRVGIGTTNPVSFTLQVAGSVGPNSDDTWTLGSASLRWDAVFAANGTIQTSDARLKRGIKPLGYGLSELMRLRPVSFRWKDGADTRLHLGLLAQEVEQVVPEAVVKGDNKAIPLGMNYSEFIPVLIKAGQEQQAQIEQQRIQIKEQQREIESLKRRIQEYDALKALVCADHPDAEVCNARSRTTGNN